MNPTGQNTNPAASEREILIRRRFAAPRPLVWDAMTDPLQIIQWWGPNGFTTTIHEMEVRPGGPWNLTMHGPDGANYPNESVFTEVVPPERLSFTHRRGREGSDDADFQGTWTFDAPSPNETVVTIRMVFSSGPARDHVAQKYGAIEGGQQTLQRLDDYLTKADVVIERTFAVPVETLWRALTEKEAMKEWGFELAEFKPEVGFEFAFVVEHQGNVFDHRCRITAVVPGQKLAYTWRYEGHDGDSLVTFEIFPEGEKTRLKLTHAGLDSFPKLPPFARPNFSRGWAEIIKKSLDGYLASK